MMMTANSSPTANESAGRATEKYISPTPEMISDLRSRGCHAEDWSRVHFAPACDLTQISNARFRGDVFIDEGAVVRDVPGGISNCHIGKGAVVENVARLEFDPEAPLGVGIQIAALDETGSRPVTAYPGLSAQIATLMAREPRWVLDNLQHSLPEFLESKALPPEVGEGAVVRDCGQIRNVHIGREVTVEGARRLVNGAVINNAASSRAYTYVGAGVDAENFIIEDGRVDAGAILRNCYVGQGAEIDKGFTAHDSLFFANCSFENGEACALLAGPYSVSMHKGTLMIGCQTAFLNAGSSTNQSNHMYKLGPVHWGVLERGVKTSSGAYMMFGAKIGAFTMIMGQHKTHPDSSSFPFSYLFGDERGATVVVPGAMLRSCGLLRDEKKWPARDRRAKRKLPFHDRVTFDVLTPFTVDSMLKALDTVTELLSHPADDDLFIRFKGMKFTRAALERAKTLYTLAIFKYLSIKLPDGIIPPSDGGVPGQWVDVGGQIMPRGVLDRALSAESIEEAEEIFTEAYEKSTETELRWIGRRFGQWWRERQHHIPVRAEEFDEMVADDREEYLENLQREAWMLRL